MSDLTHFDAAGNAVMVDVTDKPATGRTATAAGKSGLRTLCGGVFTWTG